jgi:hypothetical protein
VPERVELPLRIEAAPHVLPDHHVAGCGQGAGLAAAAAPVVRRALQQRREAALGRGPVDVGHQRHAVARLHLDADLDLEAVRLARAPGLDGQDRKGNGPRQQGETKRASHAYLPA